MIRYYDRQGKRIRVEEWVSPKRPDVRVALTQISENVSVSTVWLGIDHQFGDGPPLIFETMVFGGPLDEQQERYSTEAQALAGHEATVARVREAQVS